jgi:hypothetical protein
MRLGCWHGSNLPRRAPTRRRARTVVRVRSSPRFADLWISTAHTADRPRPPAGTRDVRRQRDLKVKCATQQEEAGAETAGFLGAHTRWVPTSAFALEAPEVAVDEDLRVLAAVVDVRVKRDSLAVDGLGAAAYRSRDGSTSACRSVTPGDRPKVEKALARSLDWAAGSSRRRGDASGGPSRRGASRPAAAP